MGFKKSLTEAAVQLKFLFTPTNQLTFPTEGANGSGCRRLLARLIFNAAKMSWYLRVGGACGCDCGSGIWPNIAIRTWRIVNQSLTMMR